MTENNINRFTVKEQDGYFGVTDNLTEDKVNVVNGIRTEIEADWLCDLLNEQHETIQMLKFENKELRTEYKTFTNDCLNYRMKVIKTLQKHYKLYTNMAVELRHDKYANGACHNVLEVLEEIADEFGVDVE